MGKNKFIPEKGSNYQKSPRISQKNEHTLENFSNFNLYWQLKFLDFEHDIWGWKKLNDISSVLEKLRNYETMTWGEVFSK